MLLNSLRNASINRQSRIAISSVIMMGCLFGAIAIAILWMIEQNWTNWHNYQDQTTAKASALSTLSQELGYGGMIHQFKDYVLHRDGNRVAEVKKAANAALAATSDYRALGVKPEESQDLAVIEQAVGAYLKALDQAQRLAANGSSTSQITRSIDIDDGKALAALNNLQTSIANRGTEQQQQIESNFAIVDQMAWAIVIVAIIGSLLQSFLTRRILQDFIATPIQNLTEAMRSLAAGQTDIDLSRYRSSNEIGSMVAATEVFKENLTRVNVLQKDSEEQVKVERTRQHDLEAYISSLQDIVRQCVAGDFSRRITWQSDQEFVRTLSDVINQLIETTERGLNDVTDVLAGLAEGDLSRRVTADYQGAFGDLKRNANSTAEQLNNVVTEVQGTISEVKNAAAEIDSGTLDLSHRTEQAASNLQETAAASEQMSATVNQNAKNAQSANQLADDANQTASKGGDVVERAVTAMSGIEDSAKKITDIISVIDEIAFQTNLLALNASVEAARAGEAGKGFAVVAQEVRQLAQRSAQAASDIKTLIQASNNQVEDGVRLVNQAGDALSNIVGSIGKVASIVREITNASQEQASGIQEINNSIANMDEMTQQNSALVEQSTAAARTLSDQSGTLTQLMAFFKLQGASAPSSPRSQSRGPAPARPMTRKPAPQNIPAPAAADDGWSEF